MNKINAVSLAVVAALLAACGGGGGDPGTNPNTPAPPPPPSAGASSPTDPDSVAASIDLLKSRDSIPSGATGGAAVTVMAVVKNKGNRSLSNIPVEFSVDSGGTVQVENGVSLTDAQGIASAIVSAGTDKSNRDLTVTAKAGGVTQKLVVSVSGSTLSVSGDSSIALDGGSRKYVVRAVDSAGSAVGGAKLAITASNGTLDKSEVTTDSLGRAEVTLTPTAGGDGKLSVSGLGTAAEFDYSVGNLAVRLIGGTALRTGVAEPITVQLHTSSGVAANRAVTFSTSRGEIVGSQTVQTNASGEAQVVLRSDSAGPATLSALLEGAVATSSFDFVSLVASRVVTQAHPSVIAVSSAQQTNSSTVSVLVRDADGNPVRNARVGLSLMRDVSSGSIAPSTVTTDRFGMASAVFTAGRTASAANGVQIRATVLDQPSIFSDASLTVSQTAISVRYGTGNDIYEIDTETFRLPYTVYVTDSAGNAVANQDVTFRVLPSGYGKGAYEVVLFPAEHWAKTATSIRCDNEDMNYDGFLDPGEDFNGNGQLDPGGAVLVSTSTRSPAGSAVTVRTDGSGLGKFELVYAQEFATWAEVQIAATVAVGGTEATYTTSPFFVPGKGEDYGRDAARNRIAPPGATSPFGSAADCANFR